jgi:DNA-binding response OmpR family regulator
MAREMGRMSLRGQDVASPAGAANASPMGAVGVNWTVEARSRSEKGTSSPLALLLGGGAPTRAMLRFLLEDDGCTVVEAAARGPLNSLLRLNQISLVIVVAGETQHDVVDTIDRVEHEGYDGPLLLLAPDPDCDLRKRALAHGVHEVIPLPMPTRDLQARLRRALPSGPCRKSPPANGEILHAGDLVLETTTRVVRDEAGWSVCLTRGETTLLAALMRRPGQVVSYEELGYQIWGWWGAKTPATSNALAALVRRLRRKLMQGDATHDYVQVARGRGYVFTPRRGRRRAQDAHPDDIPGILVVEDDQATAGMVAQVLHDAGYAVTWTSGPGAPGLARQMHPHVILLDIHMPDMDGVEVRRRLCADPQTAGIPVIAFSAGCNLRVHAAALVADDYLAKPFDVDDLLLRVEKWARAHATS